MGDFTIRRTDEMETIFGGIVHRARASLGATALGMQMMQFPAGWEGYPNHDHVNDSADEGDLGQEEIYIALKGSATLIIDDQEHLLEPGVFARVGAAQKRRILPGPSGFRMVAVGGRPGRAYTPPAWTELGGPLPTAGAKVRRPAWPRAGELRPGTRLQAGSRPRLSRRRRDGRWPCEDRSDDAGRRASDLPPARASASHRRDRAGRRHDPDPDQPARRHPGPGCDRAHLGQGQCQLLRAVRRLQPRVAGREAGRARPRALAPTRSPAVLATFPN
jgi:hypothetical protein